MSDSSNEMANNEPADNEPADNEPADTSVTDIKAVVLIQPRRTAIVVASIIIAVGAFMSVQTLFAWRHAATTGVPWDGGVLEPLVSIVPGSTRPLAALVVWLLVIATTLPMLARNAAWVGVVATQVHDDHLQLWVPMTVRARKANALRVERGQELKMTQSTSRQGLFNQNQKNALKFTAPAGPLNALLDTEWPAYTMTGLVEAAQLAGVKLTVRQDDAGAAGPDAKGGTPGKGGSSR